MNTHIKKILAISLVVVMCLSALPMLASSASANDVGGRGYICITFDDGKASDYEIAYPVLSAANIPATSFIVTDWIGKQGYMDASQIQALDAAGWEIGSHSKTHLSLGTAPPEDVEAEMRDSKLALEALGLTVESFAYPYGSQSAAARDIGENYYVRQRGIVSGPTQFLTDIHPSMRMIHATNPRSLAAFEDIVNGAIATDSVAVVYWHGLAEDGTIEDSLSGVPYTIQDVAAYITQMKAAYGLQPIQFRDLDSIGSGNVVEWTADADGVASDGANWDTGVAPTNGEYLVFSHRSSADCTLDVSAAYKGIYISPDYSGTVSVGSDVRLTLGNGGFEKSGSSAFIGNPNDWIDCGGHWQRHLDGGSITNVNLHMTCDGGRLTQTNPLLSLHVSGDTMLRTSADISNVLIIDPGATLTTTYIGGQNANVILRYYGTMEYYNNGTIDGDGKIIVRVYNKDRPITFGDVRCSVEVRLIDGGMVKSSTLTLAEDTVIGGSLNIISDHATYTATLDTGGYDLDAAAVYVGQGGVLSGDDSTIRTSHWSSLNGQWLPEQSTVVLSDGGTIKLAPGQSFNELYIASDDGRTASWTMAATGAQAPIVTGLKSGVSYRWYLDGVEQGEIEADKDGTIALSYVSTGLHTLSVSHGPDALAPISDTIGQYAWLIVAAVGVLVLAVYAVAARHPLVLIVGIGLLLIAALLKTGVL